MNANVTGKLWNETKVVKKSKKFIFESFFLYDGVENRTPNLGFWTFAMEDFQNILAILKKKQFDASETGKFWKRTEVVKKSKNFIFKFFFLYDGAENRPPNLGFTLAMKNFQIILTIFQKKTVGCKWNWKSLKRN